MYVYRIDAGDYLRYTNQPWCDFAIANDAEALTRAAGSQLWRHIGGIEVRRIYRALLDRVRQHRSVIKLPFRCDAPDLRRFMEMTVVALPDGVVEFQCQTLREERRARVPFFDGRIDRSDRRVQLCAWCARLTSAYGWIEVEEAIRTSSLFDGPRPPHIDYTVCVDCKKFLQ